MNNKNLPMKIKNNLLNKIKSKIVSWLDCNKVQNKIQNQNIVQENNIPTENALVENKNKPLNVFIKKAKSAHQSFIIQSSPEIGESLYNLARKRIIANEDTIKRLIQANNSEITFWEILSLLGDERSTLNEYKKTNLTTKIDNEFIFSQYQVPVGVIGVITDNSKEAITNIFKAITTRNAILVVQENYNVHSIENLILLIVQEALKKLEIDENIIQIVDKSQILDENLGDFDVIVVNNKIYNQVKYTDKMYIYQEDDFFDNVVNEEINKLRLSGKSPVCIKGELDNAISEINKYKNFAVSIYTQDREKAYKFINFIKSKNVFCNGTLQNAGDVGECKEKYFEVKNVVCEYGFNQGGS